MSILTSASGNVGGTVPGGNGRRRRNGARTGHRFDSALGWSPRPGPGLALRILLCAIALFVFAAPFVAIVSGAFDARTDSTQLSLIPNSPTLDNFEAAGPAGVWGYFANSLFIVGGGLLLQMTVAVLAAYALARRKFRGQALVMVLFLLTMMLPEEIIAIPLSIVIGDLPLVGISLKGTVFGVILPVGAWGFSILVMSEFMKEIPKEIEEAARLDGVGELRMLLQIVLPLCRPALGVIGVFGFIMIWDQYLLPMIAANDPGDYTLTVALSLLRSDPEVGPGLVVAGAVIALVPSLIVYLCLQGSLVRGLTSGATKG
ncbi:carbohydrate ABC transporter membrane protein 2 (CUT1 family) [Murinocardiopsis flavida]|uniref:Carbohydrate ABC transporter membrane protein 2 (CUT1 family) n=1 Tax=Murinocardiopsis flavida TaxID=645275 RepID=A0A2P8DKP8_9ACTN|nr:carbohydrate ABC transporter permease [Murinocardiopsis flavida]PSK97797.1 carbohydrate ABC transporter membrane protein 2 (CUT1 family) [Murinocardiopsis flavida]